MSKDPRAADSQSGPGEPQVPPGKPSSLASLFHRRGSFPNLDSQAIEQLQQRMELRRYRDGEIICRLGELADWSFVIVSGKVEVVKTARDGAMILVNVLEPGDWGGIMGILGQGARMASLLARSEVEVLAIYHHQLVSLLDEVPGFAAGLLDCMGHRIRTDSAHLSTTLQYVRAVGLDDLSAHCSPQERLMLDTIRHRVAAAESLGEIMDFVFESFRNNCHCDRMSLVFLEEDGARIKSYWSKASKEPLKLAEDYTSDLAGSSLDKALEMGRTFVINDLEEYAKEHPECHTTRRKMEEGLNSGMISPLVVSGRTIGFLSSSSRQKKACSEHLALIHQAIADSIGPVVEKAYRIEQLTRANNDYAEVLGFVSHELQSPIASMVTDTRLLAQGYLGELNEKQVDKLQRTIRKGEYLLSLIQDYLNLSRLEDVSLKAQMLPSVDLHKQVIEPAVELLETDVEDRGMTIQCQFAPMMPPVLCDVGLMQIAVSNLLRNAVKYGREQGEIRVRTELVGQEIRLTVWNEGPGFSPLQKAELFQKFSRLDDPALKKEKGTGIGLYSTWRIMQLHKGHVQADSQQGSWAEFALTMPVGE